jgi:glycolate oxidase FAD binding subunit
MSCVIVIDGIELPLVEPGDVAELSAVLREAAAQGRAVYPVGGGTMLGWGLPPGRPGLAVGLRRLDRVIDYPARDMTVTVQAGLTVARLQGLLAGEGQRLPIDVPRPEQATVGGIVAANVSGPRRYGCGTLRDYVIGIGVVNDRGEEVKAGGRVVKNVAGYDLCKLFTGSFGTLGVITQVTLKVRPQPEARVLVITGCREEALAGVLDRLHASATRPVCVEVLTPTPRRDADETVFDYDVLIGYEDNHEAVAWQVEQVQRELGPAVAPPLVHEGAKAGEGLDRLSQPPPAAWPVSFKANLLPSAAAEFLRLARRHRHAWIVAHAGGGIVEGHLPADTTQAEARETMRALRARAAKTAGNLVLTRCPPAWKADLGVWGEPRADEWLMRRVKEALDPKELFNPGRFLVG